MAYDPLLRCDKHDEENCIDCATVLIRSLERIKRAAVAHVEAQERADQFTVTEMLERWHALRDALAGKES